MQFARWLEPGQRSTLEQEPTERSGWTVVAKNDGCRTVWYARTVESLA